MEIGHGAIDCRASICGPHGSLAFKGYEYGTIPRCLIMEQAFGETGNPIVM